MNLSLVCAVLGEGKLFLVKTEDDQYAHELIKRDIEDLVSVNT